MNANFFDSLTRSLASSTSRRDALKVIGGAMAAGAATIWGRSGAVPAHAAASTAPYATPDGESCIKPLGDGSCPSDYTKRPKAGNVPVVNGCGGQGSDFQPPQRFFKAPFTPSCNTHDRCYEDCGKSQSDCDTEFYFDLVDACKTAYPGVLQTLMRNSCYDVAAVYYAAVALKGGEFYAAGQQKACECCKDISTTVWCNCNDTCYDDVGVCLDECQVSLGCFTAICGPAPVGKCEE